MRTIISLALALFLHLSLFYFLYPKKQISSDRPETKFSTINLSAFNVQKKVAKAVPLTHSLVETPDQPSQVVGAGTDANSIVAASPLPISKVSEALFVYFEQPAYPTLARRKGLEGKVKIKVKFDDLGKAAKVEILQSSSHQLLDDAVTNTAYKWKVAPKQNNTFEKTFEFKLNN